MGQPNRSLDQHLSGVELWPGVNNAGRERTGQIDDNRDGLARVVKQGFLLHDCAGKVSIRMG